MRYVIITPFVLKLILSCFAILESGFLGDIFTHDCIHDILETFDK